METSILIAFQAGSFLLLFWFVLLPLFVLNCVSWVQIKKTRGKRERNAYSELNFSQQDKQQLNQSSSSGVFDGEKKL